MLQKKKDNQQQCNDFSFSWVRDMAQSNKMPLYWAGIIKEGQEDTGVSIYRFAQLLVSSNRFRESFMMVITSLTEEMNELSEKPLISFEIKPVLDRNDPLHIAIIGEQAGTAETTAQPNQTWDHLSSDYPVASVESGKSILIYPKLPEGCNHKQDLNLHPNFANNVFNFASFIKPEDQDNQDKDASRHYLLIMLGINILWYLKMLKKKQLKLPMCISISGFSISGFHLRVDQIPSHYKFPTYPGEYENLIKKSIKIFKKKYEKNIKTLYESSSILSQFKEKKSDFTLSPQLGTLTLDNYDFVYHS